MTLEEAVEHLALMRDFARSQGCVGLSPRDADAIDAVLAALEERSALEAALDRIKALSWDSGSEPAPEVVSRIYCEASRAARVQPRLLHAHAEQAREQERQACEEIRAALQRAQDAMRGCAECEEALRVIEAQDKAQPAPASQEGK